MEQLVFQIYRLLYSFIYFLLKVIRLFLPQGKLERSLIFRFDTAIEKKAGFDSQRPTICIHASSGEIEYAYPLIKKIKENFPTKNILVTLSSPSVLVAVKNNPFVDAYGPAPLDTIWSVRSFLQQWKPQLVLYARTDVWPEFSSQVLGSNIPSYIFSCTFSENSTRAKGFSALITKFSFENLNHIFTVTAEDKENLKIPFFDGKFISFDYRNMEVFMLQWLSKDPFMDELLNNSNDFYESVWNILIPKVPCNSNHRKTCKEFFLPVFYGLGAEALSKKINWPINHAKKIVEDINRLFHVSISWMNNQQNKLTTAVDYFGRRRNFDNSYLIRNFIVQSPASLVCMDKLNKLYVNLSDISKICMHIHDGYIIISDKNKIEKTIQISKNILEQDSDMYKGLNLKTVCSVGDSLLNMNKQL
jgi:hypothetical protein